MWLKFAREDVSRSQQIYTNAPLNRVFKSEAKMNNNFMYHTNIVSVPQETS